MHGIIDTDFLHISCLKIYQEYPGRIGSIRCMLIPLIIRIITEHNTDQMASEKFFFFVEMGGYDKQ